MADKTKENTGPRAGKTVAIIQSSYIPWKGYFDIIAQVDEFILYDDAQYTRRDWRNRNLIKSSQGPIWLTIPVEVKGKYHQCIKDTKISDLTWAARHWKTISHNYSKAECFATQKDAFETLYSAARHDVFLAETNRRFIAAICDMLGIGTQIASSMDYSLPEQGRTEKLVSLCKQADATVYLSGPSARAYMNEELFRENNIAVRYADYSGYPEYVQPFPPFEHHVSIVDLVLSAGADAPKYMKGVA